jgi:transcriptional regulator with XRE-family HTH domain
MPKNISGPKIKELREATGWGQIELAAAINVDHGLCLEQSDISEIERGERGVKDFELKAFAMVYGVSVDLLIQGSGQ